MALKLKTFDGAGHHARAVQLYLFLLTRIEMAKVANHTAQVSIAEVSERFGWSPRAGRPTGRIAGYLFDWTAKTGLPPLAALVVQTHGGYPVWWDTEHGLNGRPYAEVYEEIVAFDWLTVQPPTAAAIKEARRVTRSS